jgi:Zn-finger nucleic acid-binding protein
MNCRSCGGAMELMASRGYFFCRYCGSFHFPDAKAQGGIRIIGETPESLACVACSQPLTSAILDETHPVRYCRNCRGVLIERRGFAGVVEKRRAWATETPAPPVPLNRKELERNVRCPACKGPMTTHPYYGPGNVVIDGCEPCELVWLDCGELEQIVDAPGKDRGTRQVAPPPDDDSTDYGFAGARMVGPGLKSDDGAGVHLLDLLARLF